MTHPNQLNSMAYDNTNSGTLGKNKRKEKTEHPDYSGQINVDGTDYWLSAWLKEAGPNSKTPGEKFFSLSVRPKEAPAPAPRPSKPPPKGRNDMDDDIPF